MPTLDRRDLILSRLFDILNTLTPVGWAAPNLVHNRGELPADKRPGIILLDGDEIADTRIIERRGRGDLASGPNLVKLTPEIYVTLESRKPDNKDVGKDLNAVRVLIIKAIFFDVQLKNLCGSNGEIFYDGCVTDLARGRTMDGELGIRFTIIYPLNPGEL